MDFSFVYEKQMKEMIKNSSLENIKVRNIRAIYSYEPELVWVNLSSIWFKTQIDDNRMIIELSDSLQHEYLHKAIRNIEDNLGIMEIYNRLGHIKEEEIIAEITGHNFNKKEYEKQRWNNE